MWTVTRKACVLLVLLLGLVCLSSAQDKRAWNGVRVWGKRAWESRVRLWGKRSADVDQSVDKVAERLFKTYDADRNEQLSMAEFRQLVSSELAAVEDSE